MADAPKLLGSDTLRKAYPKINSSIDNANEALKKSTTAETNSANAVETAESVRTELNAVVGRETDSDAMSRQAAVDALGVDKVNLKQRIDDDYNEVTTQVTDISKVCKTQAQVQSALDKGQHVFIPTDIILTSAIVMPSNSRITVSPIANITLADGVNDYIIRNSDWVNGNSNIQVVGGNWYGKESTQTRVYGATLETSYYGFGFLFYKVNDLVVKDMYIEETNSWGIAHMSCNDVEIRNIEFWQKEGYGQNGDGITGQSSNVIIDNISGYTNDDMVAVLAYGAQQGTNELLFEKIDTENISISNVFLKKRGAANTLRAVAAYARSGKKITNLTISNVFGTSHSSLVKIAGHVSADGFFDNVHVNNVSGNAVQEIDAILEVSNTSVSTLTVKGMNRIEGQYDTAQLYIKAGGIVDQLIISDVNIQWRNGANAQLIYCRGTVKLLVINNVIHVDTSSSQLEKILFRNDSTDITTNTKILMKNIIVTEITGRPVFILNNDTKASLSCMDFKVDKSILTPRAGDQVFDSVTEKPYFYTATGWIAIA